MLNVLSINNYRSILKLVAPLGQLNIITGANGSGKSNLYRSLKLLADTAQGGIINSLATEGGLSSTFWAGPEKITSRMRSGEVPVEGSPRQDVIRLKMGFAMDDFGYSISLGLPAPSSSAFTRDPEIKHECIWAGSFYRAASSLVQREGAVVKIRDGRKWKVINQHLSSQQSLFDTGADPTSAPEIFTLRDTIRNWRFYDHFRTDRDAPARKAQLGTRTPVLHHDGCDVAAAIQTIRETGDSQALDDAIGDAFPEASLTVDIHDDGRFSLRFSQHGLLRTLTGAELSDGTLRYILWVAALLTPRPPTLMVLNEPETSLHPDLLPALARLILHASQHSQLWVVSHSNRLINALSDDERCHTHNLDKQLGQTVLPSVGMLDEPAWYWPDGK